jgi:hypothetical protein
MPSLDSTPTPGQHESRALNRGPPPIAWRAERCLSRFEPTCRIHGVSVRLAIRKWALTETRSRVPGSRILSRVKRETGAKTGFRNRESGFSEGRSALGRILNPRPSILDQSLCCPRNGKRAWARHQKPLGILPGKAARQVLASPYTGLKSTDWKCRGEAAVPVSVGSRLSFLRYFLVRLIRVRRVRAVRGQFNAFITVGHHGRRCRRRRMCSRKSPDLGR